MPQPLAPDRINVDLKDSASLLGSRICHDLISPLGAISNGLELLSMNGISNKPEMKLIQEAVDSANARVKFFRVALGASNGSQMLARSDMVKLLRGCFTGRVTVRWAPTSDPTRTEAKLACLAILCIEAALPQGGEIVVNEDRGSWQLQGYGPQIRYDQELWSQLKRPTHLELASSQVQFALLQNAFLVTNKDPLIGYSSSAVSLRY